MTARRIACRLRLRVRTANRRAAGFSPRGAFVDNRRAHFTVHSARAEARGSSNARPAFSLLEIMIAIVIFGIGMVMVATVFPVGLDMTRTSLQMDISQAVADGAIATLQLKVPGRSASMDGFTAGTNDPGADRVVAPNVEQLEFAANDGIVTLTDKEGEILTNLGPMWGPNPPRAYNNWTLQPSNDDLEFNPGWTEQTAQDVIKQQRVKVYTERTGWAVDKVNTNQYVAAMVPCQNLPADKTQQNDLKAPGKVPNLRALFANLPTPEFPTFLPVEADLPRVSLLDQVYPPVSLTWQSDNAGTLQDRTTTQVLDDLLSRRYSWLAVHQRMSDDAKANSMLVRVLITFRSDLQNRFARQPSLAASGDPYDVRFDLGPNPPNARLDDNVKALNLLWDADTSLNLLANNSSDAAFDSVFPRPWLVAINSIDLQSGIINCSNEVAALLPPDAYFIVAARNGSLYEGSSFKINSREFNSERTQTGNSHVWTDDPDPDDDTKWATLRTNPTGSANTLVDVLAWVVPPPLDRTAQRFADQTPLVGIRVAEVKTR